MTMQPPYPYFGYIYSAGAGITVTAKNERSSKTLSAVTVSDSSYVIDCSNFVGDYINGDLITISATGYISRTAGIDITNYPDGQIVHLSPAPPASTSIFDVFDWPYPIKKVKVTPGYTDQTTQTWVTESTVESTMRGHLNEVSTKDMSFFSFLGNTESIEEWRKIACDQSFGLKVGDRVKITEADATENEWQVKAKTNFTGLLSKYANANREIFIIKRKL